MRAINFRRKAFFPLYTNLISALSQYKGAHLWLETPYFPLDREDRRRVIFFLKYYNAIERHEETTEPLSGVIKSCKEAITAIEKEKGRQAYLEWLAHELFMIVAKYNLHPCLLDGLKMHQ